MQPIASYERASDDEQEPESPPVLGAGAAQALQEFLAEQQRAAEAAEAGAGDPFSEDWGLSQFWYEAETAATVAREVCEVAKGRRIACIACPSLFRQLRAEFPEAQATLFEYDPRFEVLGNFALYDYKQPEAVAADLQHQFAVVVADPPYLSEECLEKTARTMQLLSCQPGEPQFYLLTGAVMQAAALKLLGLKPARFRPQHKHKLGNEFLLYTNVKPSARLLGWDTDLHSDS